MISILSCIFSESDSEIGRIITPNRANGIEILCAGIPLWHVPLVRYSSPFGSVIPCNFESDGASRT